MTPRRTDRVRDAVRRVIADALAAKSSADPYDVAKARWGAAAPSFIDEEKALIGGIGVGEGDLVAVETALFDVVMDASIIGRIGPRTVPPNTKVSGVDDGAVSAWVGEGIAKPVSALALSGETLGIKKIASLCVVSNELLKSNTPAAETLIRDALTASVVQGLDTKFLSDDVASASAPAGILNGVSAIAGNSDVAYSLRALCDAFGGQLDRAIFIARPSVYASMVSATFARIGLRDGFLMGAPAYVSRYAPEGFLILADPQLIAVAMDGVAVSTARDASVEMQSAPTQFSDATTSPQSAGAQMVSLWQTQNVGLKAEVLANWSVASNGATALDASAWLGGSP
jgi:hypothetical protein